jgi:AcrR family transcriptional regulator
MIKLSPSGPAVPNLLQCAIIVTIMQIRKDTLVRQKEIIRAARKLIVKLGSEHITVRRMAEEIGVSEAAIYRHFKSKRDILSFLVDDIENTLIGDIDMSYLGKAMTLQLLENIIVEHISAIEQSRGVSFQVIAEIISLGDKKLNKKIYAVINKYNDRIKIILADGIKDGSIRPDIDLDAAAQLFFSMTQGLVNVWALSQYSFKLAAAYKSSWNIFVTAITLPSRRPG